MYSQMTFCLSYVTQVDHFLNDQYDIFHLNLNPKDYLRKLEVYVDYHKRAYQGYRNSGSCKHCPSTNIK